MGGSVELGAQMDVKDYRGMLGLFRDEIKVMSKVTLECVIFAGLAVSLFVTSTYALTAEHERLLTAKKQEIQALERQLRDVRKQGRANLESYNELLSNDPRYRDLPEHYRRGLYNRQQYVWGEQYKILSTAIDELRQQRQGVSVLFHFDPPGSIPPNLEAVQITAKSVSNESYDAATLDANDTSWSTFIPVKQIPMRVKYVHVSTSKTGIAEQVEVPELALRVVVHVRGVVDSTIGLGWMFGLGKTSVFTNIEAFVAYEMADGRNNYSLVPDWVSRASRAYPHD